MMGDYHVRFCERGRVKLPFPTRHKHVVQELQSIIKKVSFKTLVFYLVKPNRIAFPT